MERFLSGLRPKNTDQVEMHHYVEIGDMLEKAIKAKMRLKRRGPLRSAPSPSPSYSHTPQDRCDERATTRHIPFSNQDLLCQKGKQNRSLSLLMRHRNRDKLILSVGDAKGLDTLRVNVLIKGQCLYFQVEKL